MVFRENRGVKVAVLGIASVGSVGKGVWARSETGSHREAEARNGPHGQRLQRNFSPNLKSFFFF